MRSQGGDSLATMEVVFLEHPHPALFSPESVSGLGEAQMPASSVVSMQGTDACPAYLKEKSCLEQKLDETGLHLQH